MLYFNSGSPDDDRRPLKIYKFLTLILTCHLMRVHSHDTQSPNDGLLKSPQKLLIVLAYHPATELAAARMTCSLAHWEARQNDGDVTLHWFPQCSAAKYASTLHYLWLIVIAGYLSRFLNMWVRVAFCAVTLLVGRQVSGL